MFHWRHNLSAYMTQPEKELGYYICNHVSHNDSTIKTFLSYFTYSLLLCCHITVENIMHMKLRAGFVMNFLVQIYEVSHHKFDICYDVYDNFFPIETYMMQQLIMLFSVRSVIIMVCDKSLFVDNTGVTHIFKEVKTGIDYLMEIFCIYYILVF